MVLFPKRIRVKTHIFSDRLTYRAWLVDEGFCDRVNDIRAKTHSSCPFVWIEISNEGTDNDVIDDTSNDKTGALFLGGRDDTLLWAREFLYAAVVNANDAPNAPHATTVAIPDTDVGRIIGKGGCTKNGIEQQSGAKIYVPNQSDHDNPGVRTLKITHQNASGASLAKQMIEDILSLKPKAAPIKTQAENPEKGEF
jgi:KH domain